MTQTWTGTRGAKALDRTAKVGDVLWIVVDVATNIAPYEDPQLASKYVVTHWSRLWGKPMVAGTVSAGDLVLKYGKVWSDKPKGLRDIAGPSPQVAGPLGNEEAFGRPLDKAEIQGLQKRVRDNTAAHKKAERGRWI